MKGKGWSGYESVTSKNKRCHDDHSDNTHKTIPMIGLEMLRGKVECVCVCVCEGWRGQGARKVI